MATTSNVDLWNLVRAKYPNFASHTSKGTADMFTERGFEALKSDDPSVLDDFFSLSVKVWTNFVDEDAAKDDLEAAGFGEAYAVPYGSIIQRMSVEPVMPVSPAYKGLVNGSSPDPYIVYKPEVSERFFKSNFDYQSLITMPDDYTYKVIFTTDGGMATYLQAQIMRALEAGYIAQKYDNKLQALNAYLNSEKMPLQDSQKYEWDATAGAETNAQLSEFVLLVKNIVEAMTMGPYSSAYNSMKHANVQDKNRLKMLIRPGYINRLTSMLMANTYHDERVNLPIDAITVPNFGGLVPYEDEEHTKQLYPVYDTLGHMVAYSTEQNATPTFAADGHTVTGVSAGTLVKRDAAHYFDPNSDIVAIIADKGLIFEGRQNPYEIEPIRNPRGRYSNMWASSPNNTVAVDALYNAVTITLKGQA